VNYEQAALREILEARARERGIMTDEAKASILTRQAILDRFLQRTWDRLNSPDGTKVPFEIGLKAVEIQEMMDQTAEAAVVDQVTRQLDAIIRAIREVDPYQYTNIRDFHDALARTAERIYEQPALVEIGPGQMPELDMPDE
jgi:hypothetical protein